MKFSGAGFEWIIVFYIIACACFILASALKILPEWAIASFGWLLLPLLIAFLAAPFLVAYRIYVSIRDRRRDEAPAKQD